ncbi:MAG: metallophosphoesterase family protein [Chitinophagaceae bacterium]|nr:metallophosphoesterase family protein [Chitinophagaceae bacterium]
MLLGEIPVKEGNAEVYQLNLIADEISDSQLQFIKGWKTEMQFTLNNKQFYLTHGSPLDKLNGYVYPDTDLNILCDNKYDVIITGHTHRPFIKNLTDKMFINVGSVGLPRDVGNLSSFLMYDSNTDVLKFAG